MADMSGKPCGLEGSDGSAREDVRLPYPETSTLPDVGQIMKDLGIESTVSQGFPECGSSDNVMVKPGGLGFECFFGGPVEDVGLPSCETPGEFPDVEKIMKDLNIESPVSQGIPENILPAINPLDSPSLVSDVGFKVEVLNKDSAKNKNLPDATPTSSEKKTSSDDLPRKANIGKPS